MHACMHAYMHAYIKYIHTCIHTYIHAYIHTYMHTYIHACMHTYMHTYIHAYMHTCIHAYMHTYIHTCIHAYIHAYMHTCIHAYMHTCIHAYMHACMHAYIHTYIYTHTHMCIHTHIRTSTHTYLLPGVNSNPLDSSGALNLWHAIASPGESFEYPVMELVVTACQWMLKRSNMASPRLSLCFDGLAWFFPAWSIFCKLTRSTKNAQNGRLRKEPQPKRKRVTLSGFVSECEVPDFFELSPGWDRVFDVFAGYILGILAFGLHFQMSFFLGWHFSRERLSAGFFQ